MNLVDSYIGRRVLITGGLGFLGSNLAHRLVELSANVVILDALLPLYGGNEFNVADIRDQLTVEIGDVRDTETVECLVQGCDYVFHFAAQVSYIDSINDPLLDLDLNCGGTLRVLEACRKHAPMAKVLFSSSRMVLGRLRYTPADEDHPTEPLSLYGAHKLTGEKLCGLYHRTYGLRTVVLRISNPYGPRQQMKHSKYSILGWFMRQAMEGQAIRIFGDGQQVRDYVYVDDIIELFLRAGASPAANGQVFNAGSGVGTRFADAARTVVEVVGNGNVQHVPWPENYERIETGDFVADMTRARQVLGWRQTVNLREGLRRTYEYYSLHAGQYW